MSTQELESALSQLAPLPRDDAGPVFAAPWQAQAFALAVHLHARGLFSWSQWADALAAEVPHTMNLDTLKLYCDIARLRSFSQGAALNQVSQSAASQAIQQVESELEVLLIDRSKGPFMLTPAGQRFYDGCHTLLEGFEQLRASVASSRTQFVGIVRVAAIYSVGIHIMSDHTQRFTSLYPQARVRLEYLHPENVVEKVLSDEADLGIMSYPPSNRSLTVLPWRSETMVFVCAPAEASGGHVGMALALARPERVASLTLCNTPFQLPASANDLFVPEEVERFGLGH